MALRYASTTTLLRHSCHLPPQFAYLKDSFCPSPEERVGVLFSAFGVDGRLVVSYACTPAWG